MGCCSNISTIEINRKENTNKENKNINIASEDNKVKLNIKENEKESQLKKVIKLEENKKQYKYSDPKDKLNLQEIENLALNNIGIVNNFQKLIEKLKILSKDMTKESKAYLIYCWTCQNIEYDTDSYFSKDYSKTSTEDCFLNKKAICSGYSHLIKDIGLSLGIEIKEINGYAKGYSYFPGQNFNDTNHAWNAVKLNGNWYLLDSCWGAGYVTKEKKFSKTFKRFYFCMNPNLFLLKHLPKDPQDQLIDNPISLEDFQKRVSPSDTFYTYDFYDISETNYEFEVQNNRKVLIFKSKKDIDKKSISIKFYYLNNDKWINIPENEHSYYSEKYLLKVSLVFNKKGKYKINIMIGEENNKGSATRNNIIEYIAICPKDSDSHLILWSQKVEGKINFLSKQIFTKEEIEAFGCINLSHQNWYNSVSNNTFKLTFYIEKNKLIELRANFYILDDKKETWQKLERDQFKILYFLDKIDLYLIFNNKGYYKLEIFLNNNYYNRFWFGCQNDAQFKLKYPIVYKGFENINIIKPEYDNIKDKEKIIFKIESKSLNNIIVYNNNNRHIFNKNPNGYFEFELKVNKGNLKIGTEKSIFYTFNII